jgi:hypothetical protein
MLGDMGGNPGTTALRLQKKNSTMHVKQVNSVFVI